jgi:transporter family-2 protein
MKSYVLLALWSFLAGAGIPLIGVLNSSMARALGNPLAATAVLFAIAFAAAAGLALALHGPPALSSFSQAPGRSYLAGLVIGFYALSATVIIPRFGAGNFIAFILVAQLITSAVLDHYGLLGVPQSPLEWPRIAGLVLLVAGIALMQAGSLPTATIATPSIEKPRPD